MILLINIMKHISFGKKKNKTMDLIVLKNKEKEEKHYNLLKKSFKSVPSYNTFMTDPTYKIFTLIDETNTLIGESIIKEEIDSNENNFIAIYYTVIDEPYKNNGYNTVLLDKIYEYAKENGFKYLNAHVRETNIAQINSFMSCGFIKTEVESIELPMYKNGDKKLRFLKTINEFLNINKYVYRKEVI